MSPTPTPAGDRKDMTPFEKVAVGRALEELEALKAKERKAEGQERGGVARKLGGKLPPSPEAPGKTRDIVGSAVGMSGHTYHRAKTVVEAEILQT